METRVLLYDSLFCRLCAEENSSGLLLYPTEGNDTDLSTLVNKFLPLKVRTALIAWRSGGNLTLRQFIH